MWVGLRLALAVAGVPHPGPVERGAVLGLVALAVFLDVRRRGEALFLGNLGIPAEAAPAVGVGIPLLLELLLP